VINPNSSPTITAQIGDAVAAPDVRVVRSLNGPIAIETDDDVTAAVGPLLETARAEPAAVIVLACFSDPGLDELRAVGAVPAVGIAEAALHEAQRLGKRIGVISSVEDSIARHARYWKKLGVEEAVVADIALGLGVLELDTEHAAQRAQSAGRRLIDEGADVVVLGCTGMSHLQARLEAGLGVPVVDPCRAGVAAARRRLAGEVS
jgi:Asp/Glu/hydantoin racemase